jgi:Tfp pilus assembly protein PilO
MRRQTVLVTAGATLAVVLLWYVFFWAPRGHGLSSAKKQARAAETKRAELQNQLTTLQGLRQKSASTRAKLEQLRIAIPDQPALAEFILDANAVATKAGIDFLSISPQPPTVGSAAVGTTPVAGASTINMAITASGGYFQVLDWLNRLDLLPRIVVIDTLSLSAAPSASLSVSLSARMFTTATAITSGAPTTSVTPTAPAATSTIGGRIRNQLSPTATTVNPG